MSVPAALSLVRQIAGLVENVEGVKTHECLAQVTGTLHLLLSHSDARVRSEAARSLIRISVLCGEDTPELKEVDLAQAKAILASGDGDAGPEATAVAQDLCTGHRGEICLEVCKPMSEQIRTRVQSSIVTVSGVVSVTIQGEYIVVIARTVSVAADPVFQADLLVTVEEQLAGEGQGIDGPTGLVAVIVSFNGDAVAGGRRPNQCNLGYLDEQATPDSDAMSASPPSARDTGVSTNSGVPHVMDKDNGAQGLEYLDDSDAARNTPLWPRALWATEAKQNVADHPMPWSFFSSSNWGDVPGIVEYEEDPSVTARLLRARQRDKQLQDDRSRIGRFFSSFSGGR